MDTAHMSVSAYMLVLQSGFDLYSPEIISNTIISLFYAQVEEGIRRNNLVLMKREKIVTGKIELENESENKARWIVEGDLGLFWFAILLTAVEIQHDHPHLGQLTNVLGAMKDKRSPSTLEQNTRQALLLFEESWGQDFRSDFPAFGLTLRDYARSRAPLGEHDLPAGPDAKALFSPCEWLSLHMFEANCAMHDILDLEREVEQILDKLSNSTWLPNDIRFQYYVAASSVWILKMYPHYKQHVNWTKWSNFLQKSSQIIGKF